MSKAESERREHRRIALSLPVRISSIDPETEVETRRAFFRATRDWSANISRGGLFVRTAEPFAKGRRVLVELTLPDGRAFDSVGRVARIERSAPGAERADADGIGIEFLGVAPDDVVALERCLRTSEKSHEHAPRYLV